MQTWMVFTGAVAATLAVMAGVSKVLASIWKVARALVRFADALPALLRLAEKADQLVTTEDLTAHVDEDVMFQQLIIRRLDNLAPAADTPEARG